MGHHRPVNVGIYCLVDRDQSTIRNQTATAIFQIAIPRCSAPTTDETQHPVMYLSTPTEN